MSYDVLTVGHSTHSRDAFLSLLRTHNVAAIADVRSAPYSRANPQFNKEELVQALRSVGIKYVFLGRELGARSEDPNHYVDGKVQYDRLAQSTLFQDGIKRVISGATRYRIALLCAEKEPLDCHRAILVSRELVRRQVAVSHILPDGSLEPHPAALQRLLARLRMQPSELFRGFDELIGEAYAKQGEAIAYCIPGTDAARAKANLRR